MEYTPILNGTKLDSFKPTRGIRQGVPLSPYLFILVMEYLSIQITDATNIGTWKPFKLKNLNLKISLLLFANDVLLFARLDNTSIQKIKDIIQNFCQASGLEINLEKPKLWPQPSLKKEEVLYPIASKLTIQLILKTI